jgi:hypothetical protein
MELQMMVLGICSLGMMSIRASMIAETPLQTTEHSASTTKNVTSSAARSAKEDWARVKDIKAITGVQAITCE